MKQLLFFTTFLLFSYSFSQSYWGSNTESAFTNEAMDIAIDASGNSYTCGYITGETAFDVNVVFQSAQGNGDIYVAKYNPSGNLVWVKKFGGSFSDRAYALALDQSGNVYVTGQYFGSVNFGTITLQSNANSKDIFILKLNSLGDVIWAKTEGGSGAENVYDIALDGLDNVIITGQFSGAGVLQNQNYQSDINPQLNQDSYDLFVAKYTSSGNPLWVQVGNAIYEDRGMALGTDSQNNIYLSGQFSDTLTFAGQIYNNNGYNVGFLCQLNANGQVQWFNYLRASMVLPYNLTVSDLNEVYLTGDYRGNLLYLIQNQSNSISNPYTNKIFVLKTNSSGAFQWGKSLGSESELSARAIAIDAQKNAYITGYFSCSLSELHPIASTQFNSVGYRDIYMWSLSNTGATNYTKQIGGKMDDVGRSVAVRNGNDVVTCGSYTENLNFFSAININSYYWTVNSAFRLRNTNSNFLQLLGDQSPNSFLSNSLNEDLGAYSYFGNNITDSLDGYISLSDTIHTCENTTISYNAQTYTEFGPKYTYLWNNGSSQYNLLVNGTGHYSVEVERLDGCVSGNDSVYVIKHNTPALPLMSDSIGMAIFRPGSNYYTYHFCDSTEVPIWFSNLDPNNTISISNSNGILYTDTLTHLYSAGEYTVTISNGFCTNLGYFKIIYHQLVDSIKPYLNLNDVVDHNDSIIICQGQSVRVNIFDSINNPNAQYYIYPNQEILSQSYHITGPNFNLSNPLSTIYHYFNFSPNQTGWYVVNYNLIIGNLYTNCDTIHYHVKDSFYVEVIPTNSINTPIITADNLLCPNGSVYLKVNTIISGLSWHGPGIVWTSSNNDSVQVTSSGYYSYSGVLTNSYGCTQNVSASFYLYKKTPPTIHLSPTDGIVCPYDSVYMYVPDNYTSYNWSGPSGTNLSMTFDHKDAELGFYYCTVLDDEGCYMTTSPIELKEYNAPFLTVEPSNVFCGSESLTVEAVIFGNQTVNWISHPAFGTATTISVNEPGWYVCDLTGCGVTRRDSILVLDGAFDVYFTTQNPIVCGEDSLVLTATTGLYDYNWSTGESGSASIVVYSSGTYSVSAQNGFGCITSSQDIEIVFVPEAIPPTVLDVVLCEGELAELLNTTNYTTNWFTTEQDFIQDGNAFNPQVLSDTIFLVAHEQNYCPLVYDTVSVRFIENFDYTLFGDSLICLHSENQFWTNNTEESMEWFLGNVSHGSQDTLQLHSSSFENETQLSIVISNSCFSDTLIRSVIIRPTLNMNFPRDSIIVCESADLSLTIPSDFNSGSWTGYFGNFEGENLQLSPFEQDGFITVSALDTNGCQTDTALIYVSTSVLPMDIFTSSTSICFGDTLVVAAIVNADSLFWTTPAGMNSDSSFNVISTPYSNGWYFLTAFDSLNCEFNDSIFVQTNPNPLVFLPSDTTLCLGNPIDLASWAESYDFVLNGNISSNTVIFNQDQWMYLTYSTDQNCTYSDSVFVQYVNCDDELLNVFTPNGDGVNDYFSIDEAIIFPNNKIIIYNRWGNVVFEESGYRNTFNGEGLTPGVYFYLFYRDFSNQPGDYYRGFVELIR